ncbi:MAG: 1,2-dihydroxy-3-keto-5-methylthiopentene dioxygenase [Chaenotheca gracillima]|nr:MAG: 1,2-dihydroxy-3-keto-5-methylthiopentene dioxygenase [Chaenotheca gracillima]
MAPTIGDAWRSFWHTMTSHDRHASHDSPFKTGQHVPLNSSRHNTLTSVATSGHESQADLNSPYDDPSRELDMSNGYPGSPPPIQSPSSPYTPGMRSSSAAGHGKANADTNPFDGVASGEIQLQNFQEGLPPPPPVTHSWKRIDRWAEDNYQELSDQMSEGATNNDLNELEHILDCSLPMEVRESLSMHDGQERGGMPTGIIFGCMLLDCEEIVQEWQNWKVVNQEFLSDINRRPPQFPTKAFGGSGASSSSSNPPPQQPGNPLWRQDLKSRQDSQPPNAIQKVYAHPAWIPLARDWGGNNLAVDLAPGPMGKWGQVIIFGRDYDCKYVVARSWAAFLATVADDLGSEKWFVDEETNELKLREFKTTTVEPAYMDILRWRMDQKFGRRVPKRKSSGPTNGAESPYASSTESDRGRSPQRFSGGPATASPRSSLPRPSPLGKVTEESIARGDGPTNGTDPAANVPARLEKLVEAPTPSVAHLAERDLRGEPTPAGQGNKIGSTSIQGLGLDGVTQPSKLEDDGLKAVEL